jgi:hypothetical protein
MHCFQGFYQVFLGVYPENALFSLSLQDNCVKMMLSSRSNTVQQLPVATIEPSWQVSNVPAAILTRINAGTRPHAGSTSPQD